MQRVHSALLRTHLRPTERELISLPCRIKLEGEWTKAEAGLTVHRNPATGLEEAAVLVFVPASLNVRSRIVFAFKVDGQLKQSLDQTPPSPSSSKFHQSSRPHITLHLLRPSPTLSAELRISALQIGVVQRFMTELKRLIDISLGSSIPPAFSHSWLSLYPVDAPEEPDSDEEISTPMSDVSDASFSTEATITPSFEHRSSFPLPLADSDDSPNPFAHAFDRTRFLRRYVYRRQIEWAGTKTLKVRYVTYNVNDKVPPSGTVELSSLAGTGEDDILVLGLQEADLRSQSLFVSAGNARAEAWSSAFQAGLGAQAATYERVALTQYVGVVMLVWVKKDLLTGPSDLNTAADAAGVRDVGTSERGIGLLGFGGNKAGVAVRMRIHDSVICFVNSHLAAFATALDRRRSDHATLLTGLTFPVTASTPVLKHNQTSGPGLSQADQDALFEFSPSGGTVPPAWGLKDSHVIFWGGDLNYRVEGEDAEITEWVGKGKWGKLLERDQLKADIREGLSFAGFEEGEINFPPTFKFQPASTTYNTTRSPAYTDRVLFHCPPSPFTPSNSSSSSFPSSQPTTPIKSQPRSTAAASQADSNSTSTAVQCTEYLSHPIMWSDHRPVSASLDVSVRTADHEARLKILQEGKDRLKALEKVWRPCVDLSLVPSGGEDDVFVSRDLTNDSINIQEGSGSGLDVDFGEVRFRQRTIREIEFRNTGRVEVRWTWKKAMKDGSICKSVYHPFPSAGTISPGRSERVRINVWVDEGDSRKVTLGEGDMNDVLVLQIEGAADILVTLSSTLLPSIIALPLPIIPLLGAFEPSDTFSTAVLDKDAGSGPHVRVSTESSTSTATPPSPAVPIRKTSIVSRKAAAARYFAPAESRDPYEDEERGRGGVVREVWRLLEGCMGDGGARGGDEEGGGEPARARMWVWPTEDEEGEEGPGQIERRILEIIECLDTASTLPVHPPSARRYLSLTLLYLLSSLPEPLVPPQVAQTCIQIGLAGSYSAYGSRPDGSAEEGGKGREEAFAVLEGLEGAGTNVLIGLMSVVRLTAVPLPQASPPTPVAGGHPENTNPSPVPTSDSDPNPNFSALTSSTDSQAVISASAEPPTAGKPEPRQVVPAEVVRALVPAIFGPRASAGSALAREKEMRGKEGFIRILLDG